MSTGDVAPRVGRWPARGVAACSTVLAVVAVVLPLAGGYDYLRELLATPEVLVAVSFSGVGAVLTGQDQSRRIGWLLLVIGLTAALYTSSASYTAFVLAGDAEAPLPDGADLAVVTAWISTWAWLPAWLVISLVLPQVVPYGRSLSPLWRLPLAAAWLTVTAGVLALALAPGELGIFTSVDNPLGVAALEPVVDVTLATLDVVVPVLLLVALTSVVVRVVRAGGAERRQVGWTGYAVALAVVVIALVPDPWSNLGVLLVPLGIGVAALRYRLYDLDLLVNRTLVAVLLLAAAAVGYVALVAWVGALVGTSGGVVPFAAAFAVALAFHPARLLVQRWVDRLFFGRRGDPVALLRELDEILREAATPRQALGRAVELVARGLRLSGLAVEVDLPDGSLHQEATGHPRGQVSTLPLSLHGELLGRVRAGARTATSRLSSTDAHVLESLAGPLASAAYAVRLSARLEESRRDLLATREDERRRLRRDLHDGLGPQLASVVMGLDVLRSSLADGSVERADQISESVTDQVRIAVEDVRRLVSGLRPPVLDDLGLVGAVEALVPDGGRPALVVDAAVSLDDLPAAVEVAAYRIAAEAVTNAVRHADATHVRVCLSRVELGVSLEVRDDGAGFDTAACDGVRGGVGLLSMRERAEELGGTCAVTSSAEGTVVVAVLPGGEG